METKKRLIDVNALVEEINEQRRASKTSYPRRSYVVGDVLTSIYNAPTVDAVEVVRCEDCKNHEPCEVRGKVWCRIISRYMKEDGFCSYGERRADG